MEKEPYMVKTKMGSDTLTLQPDPGQAFLITGIQIDGITPTEFAKVSIDRVTIAYLSAYDDKQNQFYFERDGKYFPNLLDDLFARGIFKGYPVKEGQQFLLDITDAVSNNSRVTYSIHDPEDITDEMENATGAASYIHFNYGTNSDQIEIDSNGDFDKCLTPAEFPDFPFGAIVPAKTQIEILALLIGTHRKMVYFGDKPRYLKFTQGREVLFDEDRTGFYVAHGMNNYPFHSDVYQNRVNPFPKPLVFGPGDELTVNMSVGPVELAADGGLICLVERVTKLTA